MSFTDGTFVSVTRLRIRSLRFLPAFLIDALKSRGQVQAAPGFRGGALLADRHLTFWTLSLWDSAESMRDFMTSGTHRAAMPKLLDWCDEASVVRWEQSDPALPAWEEIARRLHAEGRASKVRYPSPAHASLAFDPPRTSGTAPIKPKIRL